MGQATFSCFLEMMIIFRLLKIAAPVPAALGKLLNDRMVGSERAFVLRPVDGSGRRDDACGIDDRILDRIDVNSASERM